MSGDVTVGPFEPGEMERLDSSLARAVALPWRDGDGPGEAPVRRWARRQIEGTAGSEDALSLLARRGSDVLGGLVLRRQPWESGIFGVSMARIPFLFVARSSSNAEVARALVAGSRAALEDWGVRHCSVLLMSENVALLHAFEGDGWLTADTTLEFTWRCGETTVPPLDSGVTVRGFRESDREPLSELARVAFGRTTPNRYSQDPWLPADGVAELYEKWFQLSCDGEFADAVAVAEVDGAPAGFNTFKLDREFTEATGVGLAAFGIAAVVPEHRGRNLLPATFRRLDDWHAERGGCFSTTRVMVSNYAAQRGVLKTGARITQAYHSLHTLVGGRPRSRTDPGGALREET